MRFSKGKKIKPRKLRKNILRKKGLYNREMILDSSHQAESGQFDVVEQILGWGTYSPTT